MATHCSCLENPRNGGAWWAAIYGVAQSWTRLKRLSNSSSDFTDSRWITGQEAGHVQGLPSSLRVLLPHKRPLSATVRQGLGLGGLLFSSGAICLSFYAQSYCSVLLGTLLHREWAHREANTLVFLSFLLRHKWPY